MGRRLSDALKAILSKHGGHLRRLGLIVAARWLAGRLPGPLRALASRLVSGLGGERGFGFWWLVVTIGLAAAVGALVALVLTPVTAVIALLVVGVWMLLRRVRQTGGGEDTPARGSAEGSEGGQSAGQPELAAAPV